MNQLSIDFEPGLVGKYQTAMDAIRAAVYSSTRPMKAIAADMDISQSELSRKLAETRTTPGILQCATSRPM